MNLSLLKSFHTDKELKKEVYDLITECAKDLVIEQAAKGQPTDWFAPLLTTLGDSERKLSDLFEVEKELPKTNPAR